MTGLQDMRSCIKDIKIERNLKKQKGSVTNGRGKEKITYLCRIEGT